MSATAQEHRTKAPMNPSSTAVPGPTEETPSLGRSLRDPILLGCLLVGAVLMLLNLGNRHLWTDEAETANLAQNILVYGKPQAFDGVNYISQWVAAKREDFNDDLIWVLSPWLQLYVTAGSLAALGMTPLAARLPFALLGLVNLFMIYRLGLSVFTDRRVARLACWLLLFCIPFLLHMRQCRYYALAILFTQGILLAYAGLLRGRKFSGIGLIACSVLLFHSNYGLCLPLLMVLGVHALLFGRKRISILSSVIIMGGIAAFTVPYAVYASIFRTGSRLDTSYYGFNILNYLICINNYALPLILPIAALVMILLLRCPARFLHLRNPNLSVIVFICVGNLLFVSSNVGYFFRYIINLVPLLVVVHAGVLMWLMDLLRKKFGPLLGRSALVLIPLALLTTLTSLPVFSVLYPLEAKTDRHPFPDRLALRRDRSDYFSLRSEIFDFIDEITHDYVGPNEGIAEFLTERADRDDVIFTEYGDLPLLFSTDLTVRGGHQGVPYLGEPDWIISRAFMSPLLLKKFANERGYATHILEAPDCHWENRPDPYSHHFRTAPLHNPADPETTGYPPVIIYERQGREKKSENRKLPTPEPKSHEEREGPLNLLIVTLDSLRADRARDWERFFKNPLHLQRLSDESLRFNRCFVTSPGTVPSLSSLLTGKYPGELGYPGIGHSLPENVPTLADILSQAGYDTGACVSPPTLSPERGLGRGFQSYIGPNSNESRWEDFETTRQARHWLLGREAAQPWFLWVHLNGAHGPYQKAINPFFSLVRIGARLKPPVKPDNKAIPDLGDNTGINGIPSYQRMPKPQTRARIERNHNVRTLVGDWYFRELLRTLKVLNVERRTLVVVLGSHGESLGEDSIFAHHGENLSPSALHVPLAIHIPGEKPAQIEDPVSPIDLIPTLLPVLGLSPPAGLRGIDLLLPGSLERPGVLASVAPPLAGELQEAAIGPSWQVFRFKNGETLAANWQDQGHLNLRSLGSLTSNDEVEKLKKMLDLSLDRTPGDPGPPLSLSPEEIQVLIQLGYVRSRLR